ncbi:hypothetical protein BC936DRAFT_146573 [Jimgerdemannia flammicorona]|uniref:Uncharacterized protein n=1 Tax=Jimgerdemannia flammicorona TaxID=994334 RepID=A0A433D7A2_9FUNG|nr:hypothetical protein BC936DRAFT_146573 [Jimgerdemannia flammicorona]
MMRGNRRISRSLVRAAGLLGRGVRATGPLGRGVRPTGLPGRGVRATGLLGRGVRATGLLEMGVVKEDAQADEREQENGDDEEAGEHVAPGGANEGFAVYHCGVENAYSMDGELFSRGRLSTWERYIYRKWDQIEPLSCGCQNNTPITAWGNLGT